MLRGQTRANTTIPLEWNGNLAEAVRLYEWNVAVSGTFHEALNILEVVLRNALSEQLAAHHGTMVGHACGHSSPHNRADP